jgi:hypothetical protein
MLNMNGLDDGTAEAIVNTYGLRADSSQSKSGGILSSIKNIFN